MANFDAGAQSLAHRLHRLYVARHSCGLYVALRWYWERGRQKLRFPAKSPWRVRPRQVRRPLLVHRAETSDIRVFGQVFVEEDYSCVRDLGSVQSVLDLGANVGYTSAYFLSVFPEARLVAVEPFQRNFDILRENLSDYRQRALAVHGAAWCERSRVAVVDKGAEWAKRVRPLEDPGDVPVEAYDVPSLAGLGAMEAIDLLKVDIEGAEAVLFNESAARWLDRVRNICIELHGEACESTFFRALAAFDYDLSHRGELTICRNLRRKRVTE